MKAAVLHRHGGPDGLRLEQVPDPVPGPGEVLVRVAAVCVNRTDVHVMHRTAIGRNVVLPHIGGLDPAGVVIAQGEGVEGPAVGSRVVARPLIPCLGCRFCAAGSESVCERPGYVGVHRPGGFAEFVALPARALFPIPDGLAFEDATVVAHSVPVALHLLDAVGRIRSNDRVLVIGAAGGLGLAAVQLARHTGAWVAGAVADIRKLEGVAGGPDAVISYVPPTALPEQVRSLTDGVGVTVAVDNVGSAELWPEIVASMDKGGRILTCGAHAGGLVTLDLNLLYRQQLQVLASSGSTTDEFRRALDLAATGIVRPVRHGTWPLESIRDAFGELLARRNTGKIVIEVAR
jgi:NADPH:quinone reductase-like Zn-dependent oxidoreductase